MMAKKKKLDLYDARPKDEVCLTLEGSKRWNELRRRSYIELQVGQRVEWDLLFDLQWALELKLGTLFQPGRDSAVGRATKRRPNLSVCYEVVLQGMIKGGLVEVRRENN